LVVGALGGAALWQDPSLFASLAGRIVFACCLPVHEWCTVLAIQGRGAPWAVGQRITEFLIVYAIATGDSVIFILFVLVGSATYAYRIHTFQQVTSAPAEPV
jgi:hypothetical protein